MAASLDDILTAQKNGVIAINNLNNTMSSLLTQITNIYQALGEQYPLNVSATVTTTTALQVTQGGGRLFGVSITLKGAADTIAIYDSASTASTTAGNCIFQVVTSATITPFPFIPLNLAYTNGLVISTSAATTQFCVTYNPT
jgi:hypothetical protein